MQIIIDTEKESKDTMLKLAKFMKDLAGEPVEEQSNKKFEPAESPGFFNMFQDDSNKSNKDAKPDTDKYEPFYEEEPRERTKKEQPKDEPKIQIIDW